MRPHSSALCVCFASFFAANLALADDNWIPPSDGGPLAGYRDDLFFLRDGGDHFRLYPRGRMQLDLLTHFSDGAPATSLDDLLVFRRLQPELSGQLFRDWTWTMGVAWESAALTTPAGFTARALADAGEPRSSARGLRMIPADDFIDYGPCSLFHAQVGRFDVPFTMENRTSDVATPFLERSFVARNLGAPENKSVGAMLSGEADSRVARYETGAFLSEDSADLRDGADLMTRVVLRPAYWVPIGNQFTIGGSFRVGSRDGARGQAPVHGFTTQGDFEFWAPVFASSRGLVRAYPAGDRVGEAFEGHWQVLRFDLSFEWARSRMETREALDRDPDGSLRQGALEGHAWYFQLGLWAMGKAELPGVPGVEPLPRADLKKPERRYPLDALELVFRIEELSARYRSASRAGTADPANVDGNIEAWAASGGLNLWLTKHLRLTIDTVTTWMPGSSPEETATADQRAIAPAQALPSGVDAEDGRSSHWVEEVTARGQIAF